VRDSFWGSRISECPSKGKAVADVPKQAEPGQGIGPFRTSACSLASVGLVVKQLGSNRRSNAFRASSGSCSSIRSRTFVGVAQPVELQFCKLEVRGSSPLASSAPASRFELACKLEEATSSIYPISEGCPSGQWERAVNPPAYAYGGSNPPPSTRSTEISRESENSELFFAARRVGIFAGQMARWHWSWRTRRDSAIGRVPPAGVAQLVERQPSKLNVVGSNPISRSR
jgi:hypothetical protein